MDDINAQNKMIEDEIKAISKELLENQEVDLIIGYTNGTIPLSSAPIFVKNKKDIEKLTWNNLCYINLASYLNSDLQRFLNKENNDRAVRVGIISKGCVARSVIHLAMEKQIDLDNIRIIGLKCNGIINRRRIEKEIGEREIKEILLDANDIIVKGDDFEEKFPFNKYLNELCKVCKIKAPPNSPEISKILKGESEDISNIEYEFDDIKKFEENDPEERWEHMKNLLQTCTRCYACREVCPFCYCDLCFIDQNMPRWFEKTTDISDILTFHLVRALHLAGRCVGCGSCSSVCPMGIDLSLINRKLEQIVLERFDFTSGINLTTVPPMMTHELNDEQEFMLEEE